MTKLQPRLFEYVIWSLITKLFLKFEKNFIPDIFFLINNKQRLKQRKVTLPWMISFWSLGFVFPLSTVSPKDFIFRVNWVPHLPHTPAVLGQSSLHASHFYKESKCYNTDKILEIILQQQYRRVLKLLYLILRFNKWMYDNILKQYGHSWEFRQTFRKFLCYAKLSNRKKRIKTTIRKNIKAFNLSTWKIYMLMLIMPFSFSSMLKQLQLMFQ